MTHGDRFQVLVLEDDDFTRMTVSALLATLGHEVIGQAGTIVEAIDLARNHRPDVAVVDLDLGVGPTGIDAAHGLRAVHPTVGIVLLSSYADPRLMGKRSRPMPPGSRFVTKQDLADAAMLDEALHASLNDALDPDAFVTSVDLSETQIEIMRLVASGFVQ